MNKFVSPLFLFCVAFSCFCTATEVSAQSNAVYLPTETEIGISDRDVFSTLVRVGEFIATLIGILAILAIIVSGIMYITSGGDTGRTATAKGILTYAITGLVISLLAWVIVYTISKTLGA